jgi:dihydroorotate dehydrogenase
VIYPLAKRLLFRLDAEKAHELVVERMAAAQQQPLVLRSVRGMYDRAHPSLEKTLWGLTFRNPLGIAAGFDKNAELVPFLAALGFGFIEVGTVTHLPQSGNPKPRMFRYPAEGAIINRLGFNNEGAVGVRRRLDSLWSRSGEALPPLFVNIGKNKDVPLEESVGSYLEAYRVLAPVADAVVVNVSSPNTPGLRDLQKSESLRDILEALRNERLKIKPPREGEHPIIVKIAPDLDDAALFGLSALCLELAEGMTATNTTIDRTGWAHGHEAGGLSGRPLMERSTNVLRRLRGMVGPEFPIIGVGGIMNGADAARKMAAGADLVQAYTGFIYGGPGFAKTVLRELERLQTVDVKQHTANGST